MEMNRNLNTTDEWEKIVNANAEKRGSARAKLVAWERERRLSNLLLTSCGIATLGLTFVILGATGAVADWLATLVSVVSVATGCFVFGQYVEAKKEVNNYG